MVFSLLYMDRKVLKKDFSIHEIVQKGDITKDLAVWIDSFIFQLL